MSSKPMEPMPASVMPRDDILRAYAERKARSANKDFGGGHIDGADQIFRSSGSTSASSGSGGMRTLFNASRVVSPTNTGNGGIYEWGVYAYGGGAIYAIGDEHDEGGA